ncbi:hypothetical protein [Yersinia mollaretii]|uniref:hypothetical protein n=1 Tax=Yersinia mollaretii TaxID=33060 RepID=UPI001561B35B|nr:hypothetical protein [Yersinia mollaretii]QKJ02670.1 hypothetical protein HRD69_06435 [Yersinia mollaretii ATCC 43969]
MLKRAFRGRPARSLYPPSSSAIFLIALNIKSQKTVVLTLVLKAHLSCRVKREGRTRGMDAERAVLEQERITAVRQPER